MITKSVSTLTHDQVKKLINERRTLYLSYLFYDDFIDKDDYKNIVTLKRALLKQKIWWVEPYKNGKLIVEYHNKERLLIVYLTSKDKASTHYNKIDLSNFSDEELVYQGAKLNILEYEYKLKTLLKDFEFEEINDIEDYTFPF